MLHSGPLRLFLGEYWVDLECLRCLGVKLRPFSGILENQFSENDSLVRSGVLKSFLGQYRIVLGWF